MSYGPIGTAVVLATALVIAMIVLLEFFLSPHSRHDIGWGHTACVVTTDIGPKQGETVTPPKQTTHCVTGEELARWAQEKGR